MDNFNLEDDEYDLADENYDFGYINIENIIYENLEKQEQILKEAQDSYDSLIQTRERLQEELQEEKEVARKSKVPFWLGVLSFFGLPFVMAFFVQPWSLLHICYICTWIASIVFVGQQGPDYLLSSINKIILKLQLKQNERDCDYSLNLIAKIQNSILKTLVMKKENENSQENKTIKQKAQETKNGKVVVNTVNGTQKYKTKSNVHIIYNANEKNKTCKYSNTKECDCKKREENMQNKKDNKNEENNDERSM